MNKLLQIVIIVSCFIFSLTFFDCNCAFGETEVSLSTNTILVTNYLISNLSEFVQLSGKQFTEDPFDEGSFQKDYFNNYITLTFGDRLILLSDSFKSLLNFNGSVLTVGNQQLATGIPIAVSDLPDGLQLRVFVRTNITDNTLSHIDFELIGSSMNHVAGLDKNDTIITVTLSSTIFKTNADMYKLNNVHLKFAVAFSDVIGEQWSPRGGHQIVSHSASLILLGGNDGLIRNDSWKLGTEGWSLILSNNSWLPRFNHQAFIHMDNGTEGIYLLGGITTNTNVLNDIWRSLDGGLTWQEVTPDSSFWQRRENHQAFSYRDKIWVIGGSNTNTVYGDVWVSEDMGVNWREVTNTNTNAISWTNRYGHQVVIYNDAIWLIGGKGAYGNRLNDIWVSSNESLTWYLINSNSSWSPRYGHECFVYNNKLWVIGGNIHSLSNVNGVSTNDVWSSVDGLIWKLVVPNAEIPSRFNYQSFVTTDSMALFGGIRNSSNYLSDTWISTNGGITWKISKLIRFFAYTITGDDVSN